MKTEHLNILLVEDEPSHANLVVRELSRSGFRAENIVHAESAVEALDLLDERGFDVVLLDYSLPKMDGLEFMAQMKSKGHEIPIIIITSHGDEEIAVEAMKHGAYDYLVKSIDYLVTLPMVISKNMEKYEKERKYRELEDKYRTIVENAHDAIIMTDEDGTINFFSRGAEEILGYAEEEVIGTPAMDYYVFEKDARNVKGILSKEPGGRIRDFETALYTKTGKIVLLSMSASLLKDEEGRVTGTLTIGRDFTEKRKAEYQIKYLEEFSERIIDNMVSGVIAVDRKGGISLINRSMEELTGLNRRDVFGFEVNKLFENKGRNGCPFSKVLKSGKPMVRYESSLRKTDGTKIPVGLSISPMEGVDGEIAGAVGLVANLIEVKKAEEQNRRMEQLATVGEMSARMAHEIKNPVSSIYTGIQLLQKKLNLSEEDNNYLELLLTVTKRITEITDDLLTYSRPPNLKKSIGQITRPLERAIEILTPQIQGQKLELVKQYGKDLPRSIIDSKRMEQVFLNIILNAIQAMEGGGKLVVSVQNNNSDDLEISISDTGKGIPPEDMDKIFNPFYSTKTHGTGLGLATAKRIVEEHGGSISVDSVLGKYTNFKIQFKAGGKN